MRTKVLVVDDEPSLLQSTEMLLVEMGFCVVTHGRADDVLDVVRRERPDVLLQDVRMPGLDLAALVAAIRADATVSRTPIVLFSASLELRDLHDDLAVAGHVEKPFAAAHLADVIRGAVGP